MRAEGFLLRRSEPMPGWHLAAKERREIAEAFAKVVETKYILTDHAKNMAAAA